jgi:hypothetical protein
MHKRRARLLLVTLEAARLSVNLPVLGALRSLLNSWKGIGDVARGMERQGFDLQLTRCDARGWRATFCTGWKRTPWRAVQRAAWEALVKTEKIGQ